MKPRFFACQADFQAWLRQNHSRAAALVVGFYKKASGKCRITYPEALDEALAFGWIDGVRQSLDAERYTIRFSPRKPRSVWSTVNVAHVERLKTLGLMQPPGLEAFEKRDPSRSGIYSFENRPKALTEECANRFKASRRAWTFFQAQPPGYRRTAIWYVMSAKRDDTRMRRLGQLIALSANQQRLGLTSPSSPAPANRQASPSRRSPRRA